MTDPAGATPPTDPAHPTGVGASGAPGPAPSSPPPAPSGPDWTDQVTDLIVDTVDRVRQRTTGPILEIARGSVHAIVAAILLLPVTVLFVVLTVRVLTYFVFREVWITYLVLGTILALAGFLLWARREPRRS